MSRRLKSTIPCPGDLFKCQQFDGLTIKDRLNQKRQQQNKYYDKQTKSLAVFGKGDVVQMQTPKGYNQLGSVVHGAELTRSGISKK